MGGRGARMLQRFAGMPRGGGSDSVPFFASQGPRFRVVHAQWGAYTVCAGA